MAIITISRELAALGDETAHELAKQLGYRFVERSILEEKIKSFGIDGDKLEKFDERKSSFLASLSRDGDDYIHFLKTAVLAEASQGNCIFIGRGTGVILQDIPGVIRAFLTAPIEIRIERIRSYFHCDEKRARHILEQADNNREAFHRYFFDTKWKDGSNYHLTLNTGSLHPGVCAALIKTMLDKIINDETEKQNSTRIKEINLGHQIKHHICYNKKIPIQFLEILVSGNNVSLFGAAYSQAVKEEAVLAACEIVPGGSIQSEIRVVEEDSGMP
ncbi:MAG: cytidylate kinase-like family protein [Treponema sp.]|jgi:cytidylate kinase|nr:cytidylate kinase-like family protein [Treponema sp.]